MSGRGPLVGLLFLATLACDPPPPPPTAAEAWFREAASAAGLDFRHVSGHAGPFWLPEVIGGGVCLLDADGDGDLDVYLVQSGSLHEPETGETPSRLFLNDGTGHFADRTAEAGVGATGYGIGCTTGDYDADGDVDLYVTAVGPNVLFRNDGAGRFEDVTTTAGVGDPAFGTSAAFVDYDGDGWLDLAIANYVRWSRGDELHCPGLGGGADYCPPNNYQAPAPDTLYRNRGDGTFADVSAAAGIHRAFGNGLGVVGADFDGDGRTDLYVANDGSPNQLWINRGDGRFRDEAVFRGSAVNEQGTPEAGMGVAAVDLSGDGWLDLFMTHVATETHTLYVNRGGLFDDATVTRGLALPSKALTGFGVGFADFDHDGTVDLYVANGRVARLEPTHDPADPYAEPNSLFRGTSEGGFEQLDSLDGLATPLVATSRGAAFGDLDEDGDVDIVVVNRDAEVHLLRNVVGDGRPWIRFRVLDAQGLDALGAVVTIETSRGRQVRTVQASYGYCASHDPRVHFGLGDASQAERVQVRWPDGHELTLGVHEAGRTYELRR